MMHPGVWGEPSVSPKTIYVVDQWERVGCISATLRRGYLPVI